MKADKRRTTPCLRLKVHHSTEGMKPTNKRMKSAEDQSLERFGNNGITQTKEGYLIRVVSPTAEEERRKTLEGWELFKSIDLNAMQKQHEEYLISRGRQEAAKAFEQVNLKPIADDARRSAKAAEGARAASESAANNSKAALEELAQWHEWVKGLKSNSRRAKHLGCAAVFQEAVFAKWNEYCAECKKKHCRPSWQECLDNHGSEVIHVNKMTYKTYQLLDLAPDEKTLRAIIHNVQAKQSARNRKSKSRQNHRQK